MPKSSPRSGVYGGIYTSIGVAHAMQGPRRMPGPSATGLRRWGGKWRPRLVLLTVIYAVAAASHIVALPVVALLGLIAMLWVAEGRRAQVLPIVLFTVAGALVLLFAGYGFSPDAFSYVFRSAAGYLTVSFEPVRRFFTALPNAGITVAAAAAALLFIGLRRSRYFGNTVPLACAAILMCLVTTGVRSTPWLWALPFLLTFIGGVFADAYESPRSRHGPRRSRRHRPSAGRLLPPQPSGLAVSCRIPKMRTRMCALFLMVAAK